MYVPKAQRASTAGTSTRYAAALRVASQAWSGTRFSEDKDGRQIRVWGNGYEDYVTDADVRDWLVGIRVVEDLRDGLEFVREAYIKKMISDDMLRLIDGHYWVTAKAAEKFDLPKVMGLKFPA